MLATVLTLVAAPASARSLSIPRVDVAVALQPDGSLLISENLQFAFDGAYRGGYRDIPLRAGESITAVEVLENGVPYAPGAPTALGSTGAPGTYGVERIGSVVRVVWHYRAQDTVRTFTVRYVLSGLTVAYTDVVDVNLKVWGDEWEQSVGRLRSAFAYPQKEAMSPGDVRVFGHPSTVDGSTSLGEDGVSPRLEASNVPPSTFVEMRVVLPRSVLTSTAGAQEVGRAGLDEILEQEAFEAERANRTASAARWTILVLLVLLALIPIALLFGYVAYGRERRPNYDREYEQAPPTGDSPALVNGLLAQGHADEQAFTAVMFDLIRRGVLTATPTQATRSTFLGLRTETISDLEIGLGDETAHLDGDERFVLDIVRRLLEDGPLPLSAFRVTIRENAQENHDDYQDFQAAVRSELLQRKLIDRAGRYFPWAVLGVLAAVVAIGWFIVTPLLTGEGSVIDPGLLRFGFGAVGVLGALIVIVMASQRKLWVRLTPAGALLAARWEAFRRYLEDFSRMEEAPVISLPLWEEYLVYGIALGVADDVLEAARIAAPVAVEETSSLYWYGNQGFSGGHSSNAIAGIGTALRGAFAPPASSGGGGGGFSGGGGSGGGGGGGGGW